MSLLDAVRAKKKDLLQPKHLLRSEDILLRYPYVCTCAMLARVDSDGLINDKEREAIGYMASSMLLTDEETQRAIQASESEDPMKILETVVELITDNRHKMIFIIDLYMVALADSSLTESEEECINSLCDLMSLKTIDKKNLKLFSELAQGKDVSKLKEVIISNESFKIPTEIIYYYLPGLKENQGDKVANNITDFKENIASRQSTGNTVGNLVNGGLIAENNGMLYLNFKNSHETGKLYKMDSNECDASILTNESCEYINVLDEWVYYSNRSDGYKLYKIKNDGSGRKKLNDDSSCFINVVGEWIYYSNRSEDFKLYKIRADGTGKKLLVNASCKYINVIGNWIFYLHSANGNKLCKVRVDGRKHTTICNDHAKFINVSGDWIYYRNDSDSGSLYKIKVDGTGGRRLSREKCAYLNVYGDWVYYQNESDSNRLYKIDIHGNVIGCISDDRCYKIQVIDGWIFYKNRSDEFRLYKVNDSGNKRQKVILSKATETPKNGQLPWYYRLHNKNN